MRHLLFFVLILTMSNCASMNQADVLRYNDTEYPPKPETFNISIIDRDNVDHDFEVIAQVSDDVSTIYDSEEEVIANMKSAARELGGDALIDLETETIDTSYDWIPSEKTTYTAKVVVYKNAN